MAMQSPIQSSSSPRRTESSNGGELPVRTSCNFCRSKKIRCDKTSVDDGGCFRCRKEGVQCSYDVRDPIGRPKKRKTEEEEGYSHASSSSDPSVSVPRRRSKKGDRRSLGSGGGGGTVTPSLSHSHWETPTSSGCCSASHRPYSPQGSTSAIDTTTTPSSTSVLSPGQSSATSINTVHHQQQPADDQPTLSDLGLAAFLESLDTLEINNEDGLTPNMLQALQGATISASGGAAAGQNGMAQMGALAYGQFANATPSQLSLSSLLDMQSGTSYAVPADLSWAEPSWLQEGASTVPRPPPAPSPNHMHPPAPAFAPHLQATEQPVEVKVEGPCPKTGKASCCCGEPEAEDSKPAASLLVAQIDPALEQQQRVHCVPNPNGKGCTCLCDVSVALINVRATLREARAQAHDEGVEGGEEKAGGLPKKAAAASTLQLTLSASQAVADQCACSASCPTCRSDPSTSLSASLLISSALQIYIRAVRTLRQGFGASHDGITPVPGNEWDVSIGQYRPKPHNAKRISLFAMKLELRDLRDAIAKVSNAASASLHDAAAAAAAASASSLNTDALIAAAEGVSPIDSIVIRKLHQQITQLLHTVEGIEQQQDAERDRVTVS